MAVGCGIIILGGSSWPVSLSSASFASFALFLSLSLAFSCVAFDVVFFTTL